MDEGQVGRIGLGWASGPSRKTHSSRSVPLEKQPSSVEEHGAELFISLITETISLALTLDTQNAALWVCVCWRGRGFYSAQAFEKAAALWAIIPGVISPR